MIIYQQCFTPRVEFAKDNMIVKWFHRYILASYICMWLKALAARHELALF